MAQPLSPNSLNTGAQVAQLLLGKGYAWLLAPDGTRRARESGKLYIEDFLRFGGFESIGLNPGIGSGTGAEGVFQITGSTYRSLTGRSPAERKRLGNQVDFMGLSEAAALRELSVIPNFAALKQSPDWPYYFYAYHNLGGPEATKVLTAIQQGRGNQTLESLGLTDSSIRNNPSLTLRDDGTSVTANEYIQFVKQHLDGTHFMVDQVRNVMRDKAPEAIAALPIDYDTRASRRVPSDGARSAEVVRAALERWNNRTPAVASSDSFWKNPLVWLAGGVGALFVVPSLFGSSGNNREEGGGWFAPLAAVAAVVGGLVWWNSSKTASAAPTRPRRTGFERRSGDTDVTDAVDVVDPAMPRRVVEATEGVRRASDIVAVVATEALRDMQRLEGVTMVDGDERRLTLARAATERQVLI